MRIIGYDVGIKNLAYCIVDLPDDPSADLDKTFAIQDWNIINIIGSEEPCCVERCPLTGSYELLGADEKKHACILHHDECVAAMKDAKTREAEAALDASLTTKKREAAIAAALKPIKSKKITGKVADVSADELRVSLVKCLDARAALLDADEVVIENQPTLKNPRMKAVSDTLYTWYIIRGQIDHDRVKKISFVAPSSKLRGVAKPLVEGAKTERDKYKQTKQLAITYSKQLLEASETQRHWVTLLDRHDKKDDMCDAFLHALQYAKVLRAAAIKASRPKRAARGAPSASVS